MEISMRAKHGNRNKTVFFILVALVGICLAGIWLAAQNIPVLQPAGTVAHQERNLMFLAVGLCAIVVVPVFFLTITIALKYREGNTKQRKYRPDYDHSRVLEFTWWGIPIIIIAILSVVAWDSAHQLDPFKALAASPGTKPLSIQVVSLDWKWLFIYPDQKMASVNFAQIPVNTPVDFHVTSDTVMNSFWVPQLGGQIYSMPGMSTQLNLMASRIGNYHGSSANISGQGFAGMNFTIRASSKSAFDNWVKKGTNAPSTLNQPAYDTLAMPSQNNPVAYYSSPKAGLYDDIVMKYMMPSGNMAGM